MTPDRMTPGRLTEARVIARDTRDQLGEGLMWSAREDAVYWTDILQKQLHRLRLADDVVTSWSMPEMIGWVVERDNAPGLIAGFKSAIVELALDPVVATPIVAPEPGLPNNRRNDAKADAHGRIWAGSMDVEARVPTGSLFRLDADRSLTRMDGGYTICNGPAFSPDGRVLYHTDTALGSVYKFALHDDGSLGPRDVFVQFEADWGKPDGMTTDADGCVWIAHWGTGRVSCFDAHGRMMRTIAFPASQITNCTFAGAALDRMFVTSAAVGVPDEEFAGALFEVDPGATGLPTNRYAG